MKLSDPRDLANHILAAHAHADKDTKSYTDSQTQAEPILLRLENDTSSSTTSEDLVYSPATAPQIYQLPVGPMKETATQTELRKCTECGIDEFFTEAQYKVHMKHSPFHGKPDYGCTECRIMFKNQIELLTHIESKPHRTRWVLSII